MAMVAAPARAPAAALLAILISSICSTSLASQGWFWPGLHTSASKQSSSRGPKQRVHSHLSAEATTEAEKQAATIHAERMRNIPFHGLVSFLEESAVLSATTVPAPAPPAESSIDEAQETTTEKILDTTVTSTTATSSTTPPPPYTEEETTALTVGPSIPHLENSSLTEEETQARDEAEKDCAVSDWEEWSGCAYVKVNELRSEVQTRSRKILNPPQEGGARCPALTEQRSCAKSDKGTDTLKPIVR